MSKFSSPKKAFENYSKNITISSSNKMKSPLNALKKTDSSCCFLKKSKKHLKSKLESRNRS